MKRGRKRLTIADRFWPKVNKTESCWLWTGAVASGYGTIGEGGKYGRQLNAHRVSYELTYGKFDPKLYVLHKCDVKLCINPEHLFLGTQQENVDDMIAKGRAKQGHLYGKDHPNYGKPLPDYQREAIRKARSKNFTITSPEGIKIEGFNLTKFCRDNGLNQTEMWKVITGRVIKHRGYTR